MVARRLRKRSGADMGRMHFSQGKALPQKQRSHGSRSRGDRLCSMCVTINFDRYLVERMRPTSLGILADARRRRRCPFCRLVTRCLTSYLGSSIVEKCDQIVLLWTNLSWVESVETLQWDGLRSSSHTNKFDLRIVDRRRPDLRAYRFLVGLQAKSQLFRPYVESLQNHWARSNI